MATIYNISIGSRRRIKFKPSCDNCRNQRSNNKKAAPHLTLPVYIFSNYLDSKYRAKFIESRMFS